MHNAALAHVGLAHWQYHAVPVTPSRLPQAIAELRGDDYAGANITVPHKETVLPLLDGLTPLAGVIGAVNTIVKREGQLIGHNTDAAGLLADLHARGVGLADQSVLVLGAGGAARAVLAACAGVGAHLRVAARRRLQAESLRAVAPALRVFDLTLHDLQRAADGCGLIVNATPLGMSPHTHASPWFADAPFPRSAFVYDLVYNPAETLLVKQARAAGLPAATGLGMLVEQGALAFEQWTGVSAPRAVMRQAAESALGDGG